MGEVRRVGAVQKPAPGAAQARLSPGITQEFVAAQVSHSYEQERTNVRAGP